MKKSFFFLLLSCFLFSISAEAQTTRDQDAEEDLDYYNQRRDSDRFDDGGGKLWYGTGAQLGFFGGQNTSVFNIGLTPIVGYKINNIISVGPRAGILYNRFSQQVPEFKAGYFNWSIGAFTRAKIFRGIFAHAEYSLINEVDGFDGNGETVRTTRAVPFLGAGLQQGGGPGQTGFEILLLFRLTQSEFVTDSPYEFRTGINYNF